MSLKKEQGMTPLARLFKTLLENHYSVELLEMVSPLFEKYDRQTIQAEVAQIIEDSTSEEEAIAMLQERYPELKK